MKKIAQGLSFLMHPLLLPLYILLIVFNVNSVFIFISQQVKIYCYLVTFFSLVFMPLISLYVLKRFKLISSYDLDRKQERVYPILVTVIFAFLGFWLIGRVVDTTIVQQLYLVTIIVLSAFSIITIRWKMSMHMTSIGAACGFLAIFGLKYCGNSEYMFMLLLILSGMLASSRLYLKKHDPLQIYVGFLFGFGFVFGILF